MEKNPQNKKTSIGLEVEMFTVDSEGTLTNKCDVLLDALDSNKKLKSLVRKEFAKSMFEMGAKPANSIDELATNFLPKLSEVLELAKSKDINLLPLACYPAKSRTQSREDTAWYKALKFFLGKNFPKLGKICGFHFHYELPKGIIKKKSESIKRVKRSDAKDVFLNLYNLSIAIDPVAITLCQASPYFEGVNYAKDCRTIMFRDLSIRDEIYGLYEQYPIFGGLPHYEFTLEDLRHVSSKRKNLYLDILHQNQIKTNEIVTEPDLKFMWGPVRVNKIGTLEFRGLDMNYPSYLFSTASLMTHALNGIKDHELETAPSDIGLSEPFKIEDDVVYLPPFSHVKSIELLSSRFGLSNSAVYNYCNALLNFTCKVSNFKDSKAYHYVKNILTTKKTMSDNIIDLIKKNDEKDLRNPQESLLKYAASYYANHFEKNINDTIKMFE